MAITPTFRLPRSSQKRTALGFLQLLTSVDLYAPPGLQFRGQILSPGAPFDPLELPRPAVLLENAGSERVAAARSRYSFANLWVLWDFNFERREWVEVVRCHSQDASWTIHFAPVAHRLLHPADITAAEDIAKPVAEQLAALIEEQLNAVSREVCCYVLAYLDQYVLTQIVRRTAALSILKIGVGSEARYPRMGAHEGKEAGSLRPRVSAA